MKNEVAKYIDKCLTCQKVKARHQHPAGELWPLEIPTLKWDSILMDFVMGLPPFCLEEECYMGYSRSAYQVGPFSANQRYQGS